MVVINNCCCFNLKTGGIIVGWIGMISAIISFSGLIGAMSCLDLIISGPENRSIVKSFMIVGIGLHVISLVIEVSFIYGIIKVEHLFIIPWLMKNMLNLIFAYGLSLIGGIILSVLIHPAFIILLLLGLLLSAIYTYIYLCMYTLFKKLREEKMLSDNGSNQLLNLEI